MMPDIHEGPTDKWLQCYTTNCVAGQEVNQIISALKCEGLVLEDDQGILSWRDFPDKPSVLHKKNKSKKPTKNKDESATGNNSNNNSGTTATASAQESPAPGKNERAIFRPLGDIINAIAQVPLPNLSPSCKYEEEPYSTESEISGSQHHIDGFLRLLETTSPRAPKGSRAATSDVAVNFEFKLNDKPEEITDNRWKVLYSAYHNMHSDCQRKHTYSITIEDYRVCLWYFSRSHSAKSQEFNLLDVRTVVQALSSLIFSTVEDLGYDADMRRVVEWDEEIKEDQIRYVYRLTDDSLKTRFFKTMTCRDEYDDLRITGRATRVWEVVEVTSFDDTAALPDVERMVLRDVWLDHGSQTESKIQKEIFKSCDELGRNFPADNDARLHNVDDATKALLRQRLQTGSYKQLFLTIEADYQGATSKTRAEGFTPAPDIFIDPVYINQEAKRHGSDAQRGSTSRISDTPDVSVPNDVQQAGASREYAPKRRNFVVYKEVCSALHELQDLHQVVQALLDALLALQILFLISWIHRDVSSGNILWYEGGGKLGDLEYAKIFDLTVGRRSSDPKTGTQIFMAVELQSKGTIYKDTTTSEKRTRYQRARKQNPRPAVRHNFQHDVESIFWIMTWILFTHTESQYCMDEAARMFYSRDLRFYTNRQQFLTDEGLCEEWLESVRPPLCDELIEGITVIRKSLHEGYLARGKSINDRSTYPLIYSEVRKALQDIVDTIPPGVVTLKQPRKPFVDLRSGWRPRTDELLEKSESPEGVILAPHRIESVKRPRGTSDADNGSRPEKRPARG